MCTSVQYATLRKKLRKIIIYLPAPSVLFQSFETATTARTLMNAVIPMLTTTNVEPKPFPKESAAVACVCVCVCVTQKWGREQIVSGLRKHKWTAKQKVHNKTKTKKVHSKTLTSCGPPYGRRVHCSILHKLCWISPI